MNKSATGILWLKLDATSKRQLQDAFPPHYPDTYYDHITLVFGTPQEPVNHLIGTRSTAIVYAHAHNDKIQAVRVRANGLPDTYGVPHVTLSAQPGVEAFESVAMLQGEHEETEIDPPLEITGTIEFIPL